MRLSRAFTRARYWFLATAAVFSACWVQSAKAESVASSAVVMPRSVTSRPSPWRSGWENDRVSCGLANREVGRPRLSLDQKLLKESDVVAPEGSSCEIDVSKR